MAEGRIFFAKHKVELIIACLAILLVANVVALYLIAKNANAIHSHGQSIEHLLTACSVKIYESATTKIDVMSEVLQQASKEIVELRRESLQQGKVINQTATESGRKFLEIDEWRKRAENHTKAINEKLSALANDGTEIRGDLSQNHNSIQNLSRHVSSLENETTVSLQRHSQKLESHDERAEAIQNQIENVRVVSRERDNKTNEIFREFASNLQLHDEKINASLAIISEVSHHVAILANDTMSWHQSTEEALHVHEQRITYAKKEAASVKAMLQKELLGNISSFQHSVDEYRKKTNDSIKRLEQKEDERWKVIQPAIQISNEHLDGFKQQTVSDIAQWVFIAVISACLLVTPVLASARFIRKRVKECRKNGSQDADGLDLFGKFFRS